MIHHSESYGNGTKEITFDCSGVSPLMFIGVTCEPEDNYLIRVIPNKDKITVFFKNDTKQDEVYKMSWQELNIY